MPSGNKLHNPVPEQRLEIMPIEKSAPITSVIDMLRDYDWSHQRRLSFEYIMFDGVNDSLLYARELSKLLVGLDCRINLIRFHVIPMSKLKPSSNENMIKFRDFLTAKGFISTIRARGVKIFLQLAECFLLRKLKIRASKIIFYCIFVRLSGIVV